MPKGGARTRSGPPPDPNALRRDRKSDGESWTTLPAACDLPVPAWPLIDPVERELAMWSRLWVRPQAAAWHRLDLTDLVGLYVRRFCEAEVPESSTALSTLVRQLADQLGLTAPGMLSLRWRIGEPAAVESARAAAPVTDLRSRLAAAP